MVWRQLRLYRGRPVARLNGKFSLPPDIFSGSKGNKPESLRPGHSGRKHSSGLSGQLPMKAILFVDDHEVLARLSCEILEMQGYRAVCAYNAEDALRKFEQEKFDILVTDFRMEGMNGLELARHIHAKDPSIPVIIVTGYGPVESGSEVKECLNKDELFPGLLEKIKYYLDEVSEQEKTVQSA